jgi:hypothetical protein
MKCNLNINDTIITPDLNSKLEYIKNTENWILKLMPYQLDNKDPLVPFKKSPWGGLELYKELINICTDHKFLYRKNFIDQTKSLACAFSSNTFSRNRKNFDVVLTDKEIINAKNILLEEYYKMKDLYDLFPAEIIAYEDFATPNRKYPDYKNVQGNFDIIEDFDVLKEVFGK